MHDVTNKYCSMIEAFECDFSLALDRDSDFSLIELQTQIDEKSNPRLFHDIDLLNELSFGLRHNQLKIIQFKE